MKHIGNPQPTEAAQEYGITKFRFTF